VTSPRNTYTRIDLLDRHEIWFVSITGITLIPRGGGVRTTSAPSQLFLTWSLLQADEDRGTIKFNIVPAEQNTSYVLIVS
jgi:hypothetical protein